MNLQHLCSAPHVTVYFDTTNQWLYLEWEGELALLEVQHACLEIAQCFVKHPYARVLNNNTQVTSTSYDVAPWLAQFFVRHLHLAGVERLAWVLAPTLRGSLVAQQAVSRLPHELAIALFTDLEDAVHWLQQPMPALPATSPAVSASAIANKLGRAVLALERELLAEPPTQPGGGPGA